MDDILCAAPTAQDLVDCFQLLQGQLTKAGLSIAPDKIQTTIPLKYFGAILDRQTIKPQKVQIRRDQISTLNDLQKLLGDINWLRPTLGIPTYALSNLFGLLRGPSQLDSPRVLTPQACQELELVEKKIQEAQIQRIDPSQPLQILVFPTPHSSMAVIIQQNDLVEWMFLPNNFVKSLPTYLELISELISRAWTRVLHLNGIEADKIIVPFKKQQINHLNTHSEVWQIAVCGYFGIIDNHDPKHKLFQFLLKTSWILPKKVSSIPISQGKTAFTDGSSNGKAAIVSEVNQQVIQTNWTSAQRAELVAVLTALREHHEPLNIVSDSAYVVHTVQNIETALLSYNPNPSLQFLFDQLQQIVRNRQHPFFITHIRTHTPLPGPLTRGNALADSLVANVLVTEATKFHSLTHINAAGLRARFPITCKQAKHIVQTCPTCQILNAPQECPEGVNLRGLAPNEIWQMDVTHVPSFGKLSFVHVSIDTGSGIITTSAQTGENANQACSHLLICFSVMGLPKAIKTDNTIPSLY